VGTWTITNACLTQPMSDAGSAPDAAGSVPDAGGACPGMVLKVTGTSTSGTVTFNANMTYSTTLMITAMATDAVPASCLTVGATMITCSQLQAYLNTQGDGGSPPTTCTPATSGGCDCSITRITNETSMGTYSTSGDSVTLTPTSAGSSPSTDNYCVQGNKLYAYSTGSGNITEIEATLQ
jgi:hypothetical protein